MPAGYSAWIEFAKESPLYALIGVIIFLLWRHTPKLVKGHLDTLDSISATQVEIASTMKTIGDKVAIAGRFDAATHKASIAFAEALVAMAPEERQDRVREHTNDMLKELNDGARA